MKWQDRTPTERAAINRQHDDMWAKHGFVNNYQPAIATKSKILRIIGVLSIGFMVGVALTIYLTG